MDAPGSATSAATMIDEAELCGCAMTAVSCAMQGSWMMGCFKIFKPRVHIYKYPRLHYAAIRAIVTVIDNSRGAISALSQDRFEHAKRIVCTVGGACGMAAASDVARRGAVRAE